MSAEATGWVWKRSPMKKSVLIVHLALADVTNDLHDNQLWLAVGSIASKTRLNRATVIEALDTLVAEGLLAKKSRPGRTTLYQFRMPDLPVVFSDTPSDLSAWDSDTPVGESDGTSRETRPELNRTEARQSQGALREKREPDPSCIQCQGRGVKGIAPADDPKSEPAKPVPCDCTLEGYVPRPGVSAPPPGFGMPANRASA